MDGWLSYYTTNTDGSCNPSMDQDIDPLKAMSFVCNSVSDKDIISCNALEAIMA